MSKCLHGDLGCIESLRNSCMCECAECFLLRKGFVVVKDASFDVPEER